MAITIADIQRLRKMTGAGMMDCKNALNEAEGDFDKAVEIIRKKGQAVAAKREDRDASEGCVLADAKDGFAAIVSLQCETDFVAKNSEFIALTEMILNAAMNHKPETLEELLEIELDGGTVAQLISDKMGTTGEKMELGSYEHIAAPFVSSYVHNGNKLAAVAGFSKADADEEVAREVVMQIAAMNPVAISPDQVPQEVKDRELNIAREKAREAGKPEKLLDVIAQGSLGKFYKEATLLKQEYVKDNKMTVEEFIGQSDKELAVTGFKRVALDN